MYALARALGRVAARRGIDAVVSAATYTDQLTGLTLSTAGGSTTLSIAAGACASDDATIANRVLMTLSAFSKTTAAWAVGSGNGGLDTGAIANSTWYHAFVIQRVDTGATDAVVSLSATAPTLPASYSKQRRIGAVKTDGSGNWTLFIQDADYFRWATIVRDYNVNNPGTAAITVTLTVPTGVRVWALCRGYLASNATNSSMIFSDLDLTDEAPTGAAGGLVGPVASPGSDGHYQGNSASEKPTPPDVRFMERTNTSGQIRARLEASSGNVTLEIFTLGWYDRRGRG